MTIRATIINGTTANQNFIQDFTIVVGTAFIPVTLIFNVPLMATAGTNLTLTGTTQPHNATNRNITWSIVDAGNTGATITGNIFNAQRAGNVTIRATIVNGITENQNFTQDLRIAVAASFIPVTHIANPPTATAGSNLPLPTTVQPHNATNRNITWSIVNAGNTGATITGNIFNASRAGTVIVRATVVNGRAENQDFIQDFTIIVDETFVSVAILTFAEMSFFQGNAIAGTNFILSAEVAPHNATNRNIIWSVVNDGNTGSTINGNILNAQRAGTVTVRATIVNGRGHGQDFTQDIGITVVESHIPVTSITGVPTTATAGTTLSLITVVGNPLLPPSSPLDFFVTVIPNNATNRQIWWTMVDAGNTGATVHPFGSITTLRPGTVTIRATIANGISANQDFTQDFIIVVE